MNTVVLMDVCGLEGVATRFLPTVVVESQHCGDGVDSGDIKKRIMKYPMIKKNQHSFKTYSDFPQTLL